MKNIAKKIRELILVYGSAGIGKTRFVTSLTKRFGKIAYFALDEGSETLDSVLEQHRDRITVMKLTGENLELDLAELAFTDWKKKGYDTIILDTFSTFTWMLLDYVANTGKFAEKHNTIGTPGQPGYMALPHQADFGGVQGIIRNFLTNLNRTNPDLNIIMVCHEDSDKDEDLGSIGGPATVGKALIGWLPRQFKTTIHLVRDHGVAVDAVTGQASEVTKYVAMMENHGHWIARRNENNPEGNKLKKCTLKIDPVNFWKKYDKNLKEETDVSSNKAGK
jgi:hypothetical protein